MVTFEPLLGTVQSLIDAGRLPGVVLRVCRQGEIEVEGVFGMQNPEQQVAMRLDSIFRIYSMTKPITSVAAMMLIEAGQVSLDQPITQIFPEFAEQYVGVEQIGPGGGPTLRLEPRRQIATVRDLMRHTAGFTYGGFNDSLVKARCREIGCERLDISADQLIANLAKAPLAYQPGTTWEYSRATDVLGVLIERVAQCSLADFFDERIFAPLGMVDTGFSVVPEKLHRVASAFALDPDLNTPIHLRRADACPGYFSGGGGLFSTLDDYQRLIDLLRGRGILEGVRLLSAGSIDLMARDQLGTLARGPDYIPGAQCGFGLGFAVRKQDGPDGHTGNFFWYGIAGTLFFIDPSMDLSATWMMQAPNQREEMRELFARLVYQSYQG